MIAEALGYLQLGLSVFIASYLFRVEHRLTKIETILHIHINEKEK